MLSQAEPFSTVTNNLGANVMQHKFQLNRSTKDLG